MKQKQEKGVKQFDKEVVEGVVIKATLDRRMNTATVITNPDGTLKEVRYHVIVRVSYKHDKRQINTGVKLTENIYNIIAARNYSTGEKQKISNQIASVFDRVCKKVKELKEQDKFTVGAAVSIGDKIQVTDKTLAVLWLEMAEDSKKLKTKDNYKQAYRSFFLANGAGFRMQGRRKVLTGRVMETKPDSISDNMVKRWYRYMESCDNSASTRSMYLRVFRAVCRRLKERGILDEVPKLEIPKSTRRTDSFLTVPDIIKLRDYQGAGKVYADWWIICYLCNGANMADIARLTWPEDFSNELTFTRSKTEDKSPSTVHIPITPLLAPYLGKYASPRVKGKRVFPQILLDAKTERAMTNRVHDFLADIREGLIEVCAEIGIRTISAAWARNSYITTLTWHGISDKFIDDMVGHTDGKVLTGYQGRISPAKRIKINSLLFIDPEDDDE